MPDFTDIAIDDATTWGELTALATRCHDNALRLIEQNDTLRAQWWLKRHDLIVKRIEARNH